MRVRIKVRLIDIYLVKHIISILPALSSKPFKTRAYLVPWPSRILELRELSSDTNDSMNALCPLWSLVPCFLVAHNSKGLYFYIHALHNDKHRKYVHLSGSYVYSRGLLLMDHDSKDSHLPGPFWDAFPSCVPLGLIFCYDFLNSWA